MAYKFFLDPRAVVTRKQLRHIGTTDHGGPMRWHLHMSEEELAFLEANNPEFNMDQFVKSPEARAFMVTQ